MSFDEIERFLGVKWYDGLLVKSDHLLHADDRMLFLLSEMFNAAFDQPGITSVDPHTTVASQLIEVDNFRLKENNEGAEITFNILKSFRCVTPDGGIVIAIPNKKIQEGVPTIVVKGDVIPHSEDYATYLVCIKQVPRDDLSIKRMYDWDQSIELLYPGLRLEILQRDKFITHIPHLAEGSLWNFALRKRVYQA